MIIDKLQNSELYYNLCSGIKTALEYLQNNDLTKLENGRYDIDNDNMYVLIQDYQTKTEGKFEAHRKYIDIQYVILNSEKMGYANIDKLTPVTEYDEAKDILFLDGNGDFITVESGLFIIFAPQDAHKPGMITDKPDYVKKAVIKIRI